MAVDITALYCCLDDFCKVFTDWEAHRLLPSEQTRRRAGKLSRAEMLFIVVRQDSNVTKRSGPSWVTAPARQNLTAGRSRVAEGSEEGHGRSIGMRVRPHQDALRRQLNRAVHRCAG
jgi:hypothetical protein